MSRSIISVILSVIFMLFLAAPCIIAIADDTIDTSIFYSNSEEEEKSFEKDNNLEMALFEVDVFECDFIYKSTENYIRYYFKNYQKPHLNLISPPPELS